MLLAFYHVFTRCLWEVDLNECSFLWPWAVLASFIKVRSSDSFLASHIQSFFKAWWFYLHSIFTALSFPFPLVIQIFITSFLNISSDFLVGLLFTGLFFFLFVITSHTKQKKLIFWKIPLVMELCLSKIFPIPGNCLLLCLPCVPFTLFLLLKLFMDFPYVSQESLNSLRGGHKNVCIFISVRLVLHIQLRRQILGINWEISNCERKCSITRNRFF